MPYRDEYHPKIKSDLKKLDKQVVRELYGHHIDKILRYPNIGEDLHGNLEGVFSYHFQKNKVDYRVAYYIDENEKVTHFLLIGKREGFYEILQRRMS